MSSWHLVHEVGSGEPAEPTSGAGAGLRLSYPNHVTRLDDGCTLICDEIGTEKQVPFRFESRTVLLDSDGAILFDTVGCGMHDAYGCAMSGRRLAILRRTQWRLEIVNRAGELRRSIDLSRLSKKMPRFASWTERGTFLVVFYNRSFDVDMVEVDEDGALLWYLASGATSIGIIGSAQLLKPGTILIADPFRHVVMEIDRKGRTVWQFGEMGHPAADTQHLSSPNWAVESADGRRWIADTRNHRILVVGGEGEAEVAVPCPQRTMPSTLANPTAVMPLPNGHCLVADTGHVRVVEFDVDGNVVGGWGLEPRRQRVLSYPRSVDVFEDSVYLIADTAHDRVVTARRHRVTPWPFHGTPPLFWPRCVRRLPTGSLLVADARNGRIVEVDAHGEVVREVSRLQGKHGESFDDPHDVRQLSNGRLLVTDSTRDAIIEVDWSGRIYRQIGTGRHGVELDDPHSAQQLADGSIVISDTGHHRLVQVDGEGKLVQEIRCLADGTRRYRLHQPRYVDVTDEGVMAVADTGNNRILVATVQGELLWEFTRVPDSGIPFLNQPRWVRIIHPEEIVVCDHFHHRIVHVRRASADG